MDARNIDQGAAERFAAAGLPESETSSWLKAEPGEPNEFSADRGRFSDYWSKSSALLARLPAKPGRREREQLAADLLHEHARNARIRFLRRHVDAVYDALTATRSRFVRVEVLIIRAATVVPGLLPSAQEIAAEEGYLQRDKSGLEIDQGLFLSAVLAGPRSG